MLKIRFLSTLREFCFNRRQIAMSSVFVRNVASEERIQITLTYGIEGKREKTFNFDRDKKEELVRTLERINTNISKKMAKKKQKKTDGAESSKTVETEVCLYSESKGEKVDCSLLNESVWNAENVLQIGTVKYKIVVNKPSIRSVTITECIMPGFSVFPIIDGEFVDLNHCKFTWYKNCQVNDSKEGNKTLQEEDNWEALSNDLYYTPNHTDVGCQLKFECVPSDGFRNGDKYVCVAKQVVNAGPGVCPFEERHFLTERKPDDTSLRIVSYNLLADIYADSDFSRTELFPHCPQYALAMDYRKNLIIKEIEGYNADIICLQEVDRKLFQTFLLPILEEKNYGGLQKEKSSDVREGTATFYEKSKHRLIAQHDIKLKETLQDDPMHAHLWEIICKNELMKEKIDERSTILQVSVLESIHQPDTYIIVGTTHLYFHPLADNIRVIQTYLSLSHLQSLKQMYTTQGKNTSVILCGDLNSSPSSGSVKLITQQKLEPSHSDWLSGGEELKINVPELSHDLKLISACGYPEYTNYVPNFQGCLDYIFVDSEKMKVDRVIPFPSHEQVTCYTALPNPVFPSDHLALVCEVSFLET